MLFFLAALEDRLGTGGLGFTQITEAGCHRNQLPSCCLPPHHPPPLKKNYRSLEGLAWRIMGMIQLFFCTKLLVEPAAWCP